MDKKALWLRLKAYEFDHLVPTSLWQQVVEAFGGPDAATKAFAGKLARKLAWSRTFALRAVAEYRKFVYLGMVSDVPVTPSRVIDQVWHEHQLFTQGYRKFCDEILGRHFDHEPELMPAAGQLANYETQYESTLSLYRSEFNQEPPADIWLIPKFQKKVRERRPERDVSSTDAYAYGTAPLYTYFESESGGTSDGFSAFDGGESGGGGGGADWSDSSGSGSGSDAGGGDSGSSCSGSSCSSSGCGSSN